jgi:hypothetical protein
MAVDVSNLKPGQRVRARLVGDVTIEGPLTRGNSRALFIGPALIRTIEGDPGLALDDFETLAEPEPQWQVGQVVEADVDGVGRRRFVYAPDSPSDQWPWFDPIASEYACLAQITDVRPLGTYDPETYVPVPKEGLRSLGERARGKEDRLRRERDEARAELAALREAAHAVVAMWDSPLYKSDMHGPIANLRDALGGAS